MDVGNPVILGINTAFLYILAAVLVGLLVWLMVRNWRRKLKFAARGETGAFEGMVRADKQVELKLLQQRYPYLRELFTWLDTYLLENTKALEVSVTLKQDWCDQDTTGQRELPARSCPDQLIFRTEKITAVYRVKGPKSDYPLTADEIKLLNWGIMERCRTLIPFRVYRMRVNRVTRRFRVENGVPVKWTSDTVTKEDYTVEID